jgi:putative SOS response-associated peptidase YedK
MSQGQREGALLRWGLIPYFAKGEPPKYSTINARIETAETAPSYKGPWNRGQRCIQLASGFYEWHIGADGRKVPYFIHLADQETFGFAALWDRSRKPDGTRIESCALITMPATSLMYDIHNAGNNPHRMPAILRKEDREAWLTGSVQEARAALVQYSAKSMVAYQVSTRVNKPENDDEKLIEPVTEAQESAAASQDPSGQQPLL